MAKQKVKNNKFGENDIPEEHETDEEKCDFLVEEIDNDYSQLTIKGCNIIVYKIRLGLRLIVLKDILKRMKKNFGSYLKKNLPYTTRSAQRWMQLARNIKPKKHKKFLKLGETQLLALINVKGEKSFEKFLKKNKISLNFDENDNSEFHQFREEVQALINKKATKPEISINKALSSLNKSLSGYRIKIETCREKSSVISNPNVLQKIIDDAKGLITTLEEMQEGQSTEKRNRKKRRKKAA